jgi:hypothetical protein
VVVEDLQAARAMERKERKRRRYCQRALAIVTVALLYWNVWSVTFTCTMSFERVESCARTLSELGASERARLQGLAAPSIFNFTPPRAEIGTRAGHWLQLRLRTSSLCGNKSWVWEDMGGLPEADTTTSQRKRLHITPCNPQLLDRIIPTSLRQEASNISFHSVQTFPELGFGYVELPAMEADKLKKKLNGSVLKGAKVRIEDAKPEKKRKVNEAAEDGDEDKKVRKKAKKERAKREEGVIPGHELGDGRHVKRGWTEDVADKKRKKDQKQNSDGAAKEKETIDGKKMRFKTTIPPNALPVGTKAKTKSKDKDKKRNKTKKKAVVEEFKKSSKPAPGTVIATKKGVAGFEEGKGWVDDDGNVVEPAPVSKKPKKSASAEVSAKSLKASEKQAKVEPSSTPKTNAKHAQDAASDDSSSEESSVDDESSVVSSDDDSDDEEDVPGQNDTEMADAPNGRHETPEQPKEVHPLEALFKRPASKPDSASKPKPQPIDTSFSFFNSGAGEADDAEDKVGGLPPQTPHTKQDLEWRSIRSAAPTPDTAAIGRKFSFPFGEQDDEEDEKEEDDDHAEQMDDAADTVAGAPSKDAQPEDGEKEESEFRKWFYDNRGDLNRGWKKRRREERKAKRQRENRRLSRRVA